MDKRLELLQSHIRDYPDFPKKGIVFKDVFAVFANFEAFSALMSLVKDKAQSLKGSIDVVVGIDSRGFLFGPTMALEAGVPFVPVRKSGKLPGELLRRKYGLEYGEATSEIQRDAIAKRGARILVVDDLLATGGTLRAACQLVADLGIGAKVVECFVVIELADLGGRKAIGGDAACVTALVTF